MRASLRLSVAFTFSFSLLAHMYVYASHRKKIRAKLSGKGMKRSGAAGELSVGANSSSTNKRAKKTSSTTGLDKIVAAAAERAPEPPTSSLSSAKLAEIEIKINRSPVMVLWATVSAVRV